MARVVVEGRTLELTHLEKVLYPRTGTTKAAVLDYYRRAAPVLLPHLARRPVTLRRYPDGVEGESFFEKRCPDHRPEWVETHEVPSVRYGSIGFCGIDGLAALMWVVNLGALELHPYLHLGDTTEQPTALVFDLDPGPPADLVDACRVGLLLRGLLREVGLECVAKTSGGKGLHVYVPLDTESGYERTKGFARAVAEALARRDPERVTSLMSTAERAGKVLVDWSQNDAHKTTVAAYSLRAGPRPTVSAPVTWAEVERAASGLVFGPDAVLERVATHGDLFRPVLELGQDLPRALSRRAPAAGH